MLICESWFVCENEKKINIRDVCIWVQAKHLRRVHRWESLNGLEEILQTTALRDLVTSVETEVFSEHVLSKPHLKQNHDVNAMTNVAVP